MKISKLFHWLYAFLMFLPILALAPSLFYFAFNQQSQNYTDVQVNETYEYETNEVNSVEDLVVGNIYKINIDNFTYPNENLSIYNTFIYKLNINGNVNLENITYSVASDNTNTELRLYLNASIVSIQKYDNATYTNSIFYENYTNLELNCYFVYKSGLTNTYISYISASDYLGEKNVEVVRSEQSPMNIFYTAVNYVYDMPVFSWAKNSFLALPITYVTGLFGMANTNVVNYYLSYWLAISIVYLVFDLVMYVPLLVHRWIDKGMIE